MKDIGERLLKVCGERRLAFGNTYFRKKEVLRYSWASETRLAKSCTVCQLARHLKKVHRCEMYFLVPKLNLN